MFSNRNSAIVSSTNLNTTETEGDFEQFELNFVHTDTEYEKVVKLGNGVFGLRDSYHIGVTNVGVGRSLATGDSQESLSQQITTYRQHSNFLLVPSQLRRLGAKLFPTLQLHQAGKTKTADVNDGTRLHYIHQPAVLSLEVTSSWGAPCSCIGDPDVI